MRTTSRLGAIKTPSPSSSHVPADTVVNKWQMAPYENVAHIITVPNVTRDKIDAAVADCVANPRTTN